MPLQHSGVVRTPGLPEDDRAVRLDRRRCGQLDFLPGLSISGAWYSGSDCWRALPFANG